VKETRRHFEIGEVSADKAYASLENFEVVAECGGQGFMDFKANTTGSVGGLFEKAFHFFQFNQEEYLKRNRSRVEGDQCILSTLHLRRGGPRPIRCPLAANLAGLEVRSYGTHFSASEGQQFGGNDSVETQRGFLYWFQPFTRPRLTEVGKSRCGRGPIAEAESPSPQGGTTMLVLTRRVGEGIVISADIQITVLRSPEAGCDWGSQPRSRSTSTAARSTSGTLHSLPSLSGRKPPRPRGLHLPTRTDGALRCPWQRR
jgi:hypothetical protein